MKITLTEDQIILKKAFRAHLLSIYMTQTRYTNMYAVIEALQKQLGYTKPALYAALTAIPSIGTIYCKSDITTWLAMHYPTVALIMIETGDPVKALQVWKTAKHMGKQRIVTAISAKPEIATLRNDTRLLNASRLFKQYKPDTGKHVWSECK